MAYKNDTFVHSFSEWRELCFCSTDWVLATTIHPAEEDLQSRAHTRGVTRKLQSLNWRYGRSAYKDFWSLSSAVPLLCPMYLWRRIGQNRHRLDHRSRHHDDYISPPPPPNGESRVNKNSIGSEDPWPHTFCLPSPVAGFMLLYYCSARETR